MMKLNEGLNIADLEGLVLSTISVDEFKSKVSDDAIVVAFFVDDEKPAYDLSRFIEKGYTTILDTDVSPAPNQDGYYLVFVEFIREHDFIEKLLEIIENISGLVDIKSWKFKAYRVRGFHDLNEKNLKLHVDLTTHDKKEEAIQMLKNSLVETFSLNNNKLVINSKSHSYKFDFVDVGNSIDLINSTRFHNLPYNLNEDISFKCRSLNRVLGENWRVNAIGNYLILESDDNSIIVK